MKELQAGIQLVKTKYIQLNRHAAKKKVKSLAAIRALDSAIMRSQPVATRQQLLKPLSVQSSLDKLRRRIAKGMRRLENQAKRINQLSAELEAAVLELKAIGSEINPDWKAIQITQNSANSVNVCEYQTMAVPQVESKADGSFLVISKPVDLFQAEREAILLAQILRHRTKNKQKRQSSIKDKA